MSLLTLFSVFTLSAQTRTTLSERDIPRIPTDTLPSERHEVRIVIFSDGTYRYIPTNPYHFYDMPAYGSHWDTINLFAYRTVALSDLPRVTDIEIAEGYGFHPPTTGRVISPYGRRNGRDHNGVDLRVAHGQPIFAAFDGVVRVSRWNSGGFGNIVIVRHPSGLETYYSHLSRRAVVADEWVKAGQVIGYGGRTGRASADHLHFEIRYADQSFDPERLIDFERGELRSHKYALRREHFNIRSRAPEQGDADEGTLYAENAERPDLGGPDTGLIDDDDTSTLSPALNAMMEMLAGIPLVDSLTAVAAAQGIRPVRRTRPESDTPDPEPAPEPEEPEEAEEAEPVYHKIVSGDTLLELAIKYDTTVATICELNDITRTSVLRLGRNLRIK